MDLWSDIFTTKDNEIVITRALIAIPASPIRCNVLRPARSIRNSWCPEKNTNRFGVRAEWEGLGLRPSSADTHRNDCKHSIDNSGSNRSVDRLSHTCSLKYASRIVEHLNGEKMCLCYFLLLISVKQNTVLIILLHLILHPNKVQNVFFHDLKNAHIWWNTQL